MSDDGVDLLPQKQSSDILQSPVESSPLPRDAGSMLKLAREKKEWTVQYVAEQLKLSARQISWLENNELENLPNLVIIRGFIRSYSKLLKIDAEPIIALLPQNGQQPSAIASLRPTLTTPFLESRLPMLGRPDSNNHQYIIGAIIFAILAIAFFAFQKFDHAELVQNVLSSIGFAQVEKKNEVADAASNNDVVLPAATEVNSSSITPDPVVDNTVGSAQTNIDAAIKSDGINAQTPSTNATTPANGNSMDAVNTQNPSVVAVSSTNGAGQTANALKLKFKQDTWIQIKRANGTVLTAHMAKAGTEESFDVNEALQLRIGNVAGVEGFLRGTPMQIIGFQGSNVADINVK